MFLNPFAGSQSELTRARVILCWMEAASDGGVALPEKRRGDAFLAAAFRRGARHYRGGSAVSSPGRRFPGGRSREIRGCPERAVARVLFSPIR